MSTHIQEREEKLRARIMRRVWGLYVWHRVNAFAIPQLVLIAIGAGLIARFVWVAKVFANMPDVFHVAQTAQFFAFAFSHTHFIVQVAILLTSIGTAWLLARIVAQIKFVRLVTY